ncbi:unnamed protein product [Bathycoccus prasinos]
MNRISDTANNGPRMPAIVFAVSGSKASAFDSANSKTSCVVVIANASDGLRSIAHPPTVHNAVMAPKAVNDDAFNIIQIRQRKRVTTNDEAFSSSASSIHTQSRDRETALKK